MLFVTYQAPRRHTHHRKKEIERKGSVGNQSINILFYVCSHRSVGTELVETEAEGVGKEGVEVGLERKLWRKNKD